jgi:hypothetical protein
LNPLLAESWPNIGQSARVARGDTRAAAVAHTIAAAVIRRKLTIRYLVIALGAMTLDETTGRILRWRLET